MKENNQKKMLLSVLGVAILVVAVVGISFAAFSTTFESTNANSVTTGTVMVSYSEPSQAINVTDAMPISDANGIAQTNNFAFTVSTHADNTLTVPYEIELQKVTTTAESGQEGYYESMADNQVKVHLTKNGTAVVGTANTGVLIDSLQAGTYNSSYKKLYATSDSFTGTGQETVTTNYVLRMWIDSGVNYSAVSGKEYHAKVNVQSRVAPIS